MTRIPTREDLDKILNEASQRNDVIMSDVPKCPSCRSEQVQIAMKNPPAQWKCRRCKFWFTYEPSQEKANAE